MIPSALCTPSVTPTGNLASLPTNHVPPPSIPSDLAISKNPTPSVYLTDGPCDYELANQGVPCPVASFNRQLPTSPLTIYTTITYVLIPTNLGGDRQDVCVFGDVDHGAMQPTRFQGAATGWPTAQGLCLLLCSWVSTLGRVQLARGLPPGARVRVSIVGPGGAGCGRNPATICVALLSNLKRAVF